MIEYDELGNVIGEYDPPFDETLVSDQPIDQQTQAATSIPKTNLYAARGAASEFESGTYDISNYTYPDDLYTNRGEYGGNYAIFYINVSTDSKLVKVEGQQTVDDYTPNDRGDLVGLGLSAAQLTATNAVTGAIEGAIAGGIATGGSKDKILQGAKTGAVVGAATGAVVGFQGSRQQKRLKTAIALHIPNNLAISYSMNWNEEDTAGMAMAAAAVQQGWEIAKIVGSLGKSGNSDVTGTGAAILTNIALSKGPNQAGNSVATGLAANPKKEQVFKGVNFRTFSFDYKFFPRSSAEASNVLEIIRQFKYHMHPEFKDNNNFVYIYPSEFDIFYYNDGQENMNLHRHTSCVLTDLAVNYTPNGMFNTFPDGMPTQIDVTLNFRELALLTKDKVRDNL